MNKIKKMIKEATGLEIHSSYFKNKGRIYTIITRPNNQKIYFIFIIRMKDKILEIKFSKLNEESFIGLHSNFYNSTPSVLPLYRMAGFMEGYEFPINIKGRKMEDNLDELSRTIKRFLMEYKLKTKENMHD